MKPDEKNHSTTHAKYNLEELRLLSDGDEKFFNDMINVFIRTTREGIQKMKEALEVQDWETIAGQAHKILAPCRHLETDELSAALETIEDDIRELGKTENIAGLIHKAATEAEQIIAELEPMVNKK